MTFETGKIYSGFRLVKEHKVKETCSIGRIFLHEKSGAQLLGLANDDDNKVFGITFRTPPADSTGLPHILEHSVLCGSRKFPTKEPFVDLKKGSLHTFLNAMTFPDKTMYPVASRNDKDFFNLMDVYLDAVFHPKIYDTPEILMQEGWHHELDAPEGDITYKGVVYNEMRGTFSSPEQILFRKIYESLYPDTPYGMESGGDPDMIPNLTQKQFAAFHKKYYSPANSLIFLYGDGNLEKQLEFIDEKYLREFDAMGVSPAIPLQNAFTEERRETVDYPISSGEQETEKTFLSLNWVAGNSTDPEMALAFDILKHILLDTPAAPLKKALIEAGIGQDVSGEFDSDLLQPFFSVVARHSNAAREDDFRKIVFDTLRALAKEGIDKKLIEASINIHEFILREADYRGNPKGLFYYIKSLRSWLHGKDPFMHLEYEPVLEKIRAALTGDYFEKLIRTSLLENRHRALIIVKPKKGLAEAKAAEISKKLADYKAKLSRTEIAGLVEQTVRLKKRQATPDSPEALAAIPLLSRKDINPEAEKLPIEEHDESGIKTFAHPMFTNNIAYLKLYFDTRATPQERIPYLQLLAEVMAKISTEKRSHGDLANEINIHTGGISLGALALDVNDAARTYLPMLKVSSKALMPKLPKMMEILGEIIGHTKFDDPQRLREIIREIKARLETIIMQASHSIAARRLFSYISETGQYAELIHGLSYYKFIAGLEHDFDQKAGEIARTLAEVAQLVFNKNGLTASITCADDDYGDFRREFPTLISHLNNDPAPHVAYAFKPGETNEALMTSGKVQFVAKGFDFRRLGRDYTGGMHVLSTILTLDYLWNRVRVQGGAYGCWGQFNRNGQMCFVSYRDPNLAETLNVYDEAAEFIRAFKADKRGMTRRIIGTISNFDMPLTPAMKGECAAERRLGRITRQDIQKERDEVLSTTSGEIAMMGDMLDEVMKQNCFCVAGSETKIKEHKNLFNRLVNVLE